MLLQLTQAQQFPGRAEFQLEHAVNTVMAQEWTQVMRRQADLAAIAAIEQNPIGAPLVHGQEAFRRQSDIQHQAGHGGTLEMIGIILPQAAAQSAPLMMGPTHRYSAPRRRLCHTGTVVPGVSFGS